MYRRDDDRPGVPVADSTDDPTMETNRAKATYTTRDIWQASYLTLEGIEFLGVQFDDSDRAVWVFVNTGDHGWQTGKQFRAGVSVDVESFRQAHKRMAQAVSLARRGETPHGARLG